MPTEVTELDSCSVRQFKQRALGTFIFSLFSISFFILSGRSRVELPSGLVFIFCKYYVRPILNAETLHVFRRILIYKYVYF